MSKIAVITDSNAHFTPQEAEEYGISVVPMPFTIGNDTFYEGITLSRERFYEKMAAGAQIATSQPSPSDVMSLWDRALETHDEVVYIPMSSGLSGSCQSARMLAEDYDGKVEVVNNQRISVTQKRSVLDALEMAERGLSARQIREELERVRFESSIYIMLDTLHYLKKGGRITPAAAAIGSLLRIKPVLQIKGERLDAFSKTRTINQGKNIMINAMKHDIETLYGGTDKENVWLYAVHGNVPEQFEEFSQEVRAAFPGIHVMDDVLSLSIACHIGPGALAIACSKKIPFDR
ncbi:MAG TPA: DegV family protein [Lachnospiraceae bacterium]|nr:DegV family protein [Lachnospiraceae bacterium]